MNVPSNAKVQFTLESEGLDLFTSELKKMISGTDQVISALMEQFSNMFNLEIKIEIEKIVEEELTHWDLPI